MTKEILDLENNRDESTLGKIYFYKDKNSPWYHAYELSAYYAAMYDNGLEENKKLKATRKKSKLQEEGVMCIGLQLTSFKKYFPGMEVKDITEENFSSEIEVEKLDGVTVNNYREFVLKWKENFEIKEAKKEKNTNRENFTNKNIYSHPLTFTSILKEILKYDCHGKSESDIIEFVCTLKEMCADMI